MAKKKGFPTKPCPKCGKPIHARKQNHDCGWVMEAANGDPAAKKKAKKMGRPKKEVGGISIGDIEAVKAVVEKLGAEKVRDLAKVLG
jgi:hypothetical protein